MNSNQKLGYAIAAILSGNAAPVHAALLPRPRVVSALGRALTAPALGSLLAPGWSIFWNDLVDGAQRTVPRKVAAVAAGIGRTATGRGRMREWFTATLGPGSEPSPQQGSTDQGRLPCHW